MAKYLVSSPRIDAVAADFLRKYGDGRSEALDDLRQILMAERERGLRDAVARYTASALEDMYLAALSRLRRRAHVHVVSCYGGYEPCGEHHAHDNKCGGRPVVCGRAEDVDLLALLGEYDRLRAAPPEPFPPNTALGRRVGIEK